MSKPIIHTDPKLIEAQQARQAYYLSRKDEFKKYAKSRYERLKQLNPEEVNAASLKWRKENKEAYNEYHRKYRTKRAANKVPVDAERRAIRAELALRERREKFELTEKLKSDGVARRQEVRLKMQAAGIPLPDHGSLREYVRSKKDGALCHDCGGGFPSFALEFDHRDPAQKLFNLGDFRLKDAQTIEELDFELSKCDIVCKTCHSIRTNALGRRRKKSSRSGPTPNEVQAQLYPGVTGRPSEDHPHVPRTIDNPTRPAASA